MKKKFLLKGLLVSFMLLCSAHIWAYDFAVENDDGVTIYYNITSSTDRTCEVTYRNTNYNSYSGNVVIPTSVMYNNTRYAVTSIGDSAFQYCSSLTEITIPNSVTSIGGSAFRSCSSLTEITIPNSVTSIGGSAFSSCSSLETATIGNSVTSIGDYAFYKCSSLKEITIPNSVTSIGDYAFDSCSSLEKVIIDDSTASIGSYAFQYCSSLAEVSLGNSITSIGEYAFLQCSSLMGITIPSSLTSIENYVFARCSALARVTIPNSVTRIGAFSFQDCTSLTEITIPSSVTSLETGAFYECSDLETINFNAIQCASIGSTSYPAFVKCPNLNELNIGDSVTIVPKYLFYGGTNGNIETVIIPNSVKTIGESAFDSCDNLTSVTIGSSVESIGDYAFVFCTDLEEVTSLNPEPPTCGYNAFGYVDTSVCVLYIPEGTLESYSTADTWKDFFNIVDNQPNGISNIVNSGNTEIVGYYGIDGKQLNAPEKGINIVRYSDGTARKILVQ